MAIFLTKLPISRNIVKEMQSQIVRGRCGVVCNDYKVLPGMVYSLQGVVWGEGGALGLLSQTQYSLFIQLRKA